MARSIGTKISLLALFVPLAAFASPPSGALVERNSPTELTVRWTSADPVDVLISDTADVASTSATLVSARDRDGKHMIANAALTRQYFLLRNTLTGEATVVAERLLPLEGGSNFRDLGGYPAADGKLIRWGKMFRSGGQAMLTATDLDRVRQLKLSNLVDLRSDEERLLAPTKIEGVAYTAIGYSMAKLSLSGGMEATYRGFPYMMAPQLRQIFAKLLRGEQPLAYNCSAGQDRTGFVSAMILSALGTPRETIFADYNLTTVLRKPENEMPRIDSALAATNPVAAMFASYQKEPHPKPTPLVTADGTSFLSFSMAEIDQKWGSIDQYLETEIGLTKADIARLRLLYTE
jgi:protein-tyrosine phosphatase